MAQNLIEATITERDNGFPGVEVIRKAYFELRARARKEGFK